MREIHWDEKHQLKSHHIHYQPSSTEPTPVQPLLRIHLQFTKDESCCRNCRCGLAVYCNASVRVASPQDRWRLDLFSIYYLSRRAAARLHQHITSGVRTQDQRLETTDAPTVNHHHSCWPKTVPVRTSWNSGPTGYFLVGRSNPSTIHPRLRTRVQIAIPSARAQPKELSK